MKCKGCLVSVHCMYLKSILKRTYSHNDDDSRLKIGVLLTNRHSVRQNLVHVVLVCLLI